MARCGLKGAFCARKSTEGASGLVLTYIEADDIFVHAGLEGGGGGGGGYNIRGKSAKFATVLELVTHYTDSSADDKLPAPLILDKARFADDDDDDADGSTSGGSPARTAAVAAAKRPVADAAVSKHIKIAVTAAAASAVSRAEQLDASLKGVWWYTSKLNSSQAERFLGKKCESTPGAFVIRKTTETLSGLILS